VARRARHVPPFVAAPQEGGDGSAFPDLAPPAPPELASAGARSARRTLRSTAGQLRLLGMSMVLAPSADVSVSAGALAGRSFGDDPAVVARLAVAAVEGWKSGGVVPVVGHFPGQGAASQDPLEGPATVGLSRRELERRDLVPFRAVARRAEAVQVSSAVYAAFDGVTPAVLQPGVVRGLLRDRLRFTGVVVTDDLVGVAAATGEGTAAAAVAALQAGADLLYVRDERAAEAAYRAVLGAVRRGEVSGARVRESVLRVLRLKRSAGLIVGGRR
jgi:beta-N-acetylhexosaminidase